MGFPTLKQVYDRFKNNKSIVFAAVQTVFEGHAFNTEKKLVSTQKKFGLPIPMGHDGKPLSDKAHIPKTMTDYRAGGTPWVVILDKSGNVVFNDFHIRFLYAVNLINELISE